MKALYIVILSLVILATACADPSTNKPKAVTAEPAANTAAKPAEAQPGSTQLTISPDNSRIDFTGSKVTGKHEGGFKSFTGTIDLVGDKAETSRVKVEIEMPSVWTDTEGLTKHLQTADFFEIAKFPTATFTSTRIEPDAAKGEGNYTVTGDLDLHGVKKAVTFPAVIKVTPDEVTVRADFSINRKDFGILYAGKADDLIRDNVVIKLDLKAPRKK